VNIGRGAEGRNRPAAARPPTPKGSTLVELVILLSILGAASAAAAWSLADARDVPLRVAAERLARHIRYAQRLSMSRNGTCGLVADAATETYLAFENGNPSDPLADPWTRDPLVVTLGQDEFSGVSILTSAFGPSSPLSFDAEGAPLSSGTVVLAGAGGATATVRVVAGTGLVRVGP